MHALTLCDVTEGAHVPVSHTQTQFSGNIASSAVFRVVFCLLSGFFLPLSEHASNCLSVFAGGCKQRGKHAACLKLLLLFSIVLWGSVGRADELYKPAALDVQDVRPAVGTRRSAAPHSWKVIPARDGVPSQAQASAACQENLLACVRVAGGGRRRRIFSFYLGRRGQQLAGADLHMTLSQEQSRGGDR